MSTADEIQRILDRYHRFQECYLEEITFRNYQTTLELHFDYIWDDQGHIRDNLDEQYLVIIRFHLVQEVRIENALTAYQVEHVDELSWGINEISLIRLEDDADLLRPYAHLPIPLHHVAMRWEGERRIDVVCSTLEVIDQGSAAR